MLIHKAKITIYSWEYINNVFDKHKKIFLDVDLKNTEAVRCAYRQILEDSRVQHAKMYIPNLEFQECEPVWKIFKDTYMNQLKNSNGGKKVKKSIILQKANEVLESLQSNTLRQAEKYLQENKNLDKQQIDSIRDNIEKEFRKKMEALFYNTLKEYCDLIHFYDFIKNNIPHHLLNSLDQSQKKCEEDRRFHEEDIEQLKLIQAQKQSELSDQPQIAMEQQSPANKLQQRLDTALKDTNMTDQWKHTVTSYMHGLFEKSHHQSLDDATIAKFYQTNIRGSQAGSYISRTEAFHPPQDTRQCYPVRCPFEACIWLSSLSGKY